MRRITKKDIAEAIIIINTNFKEAYPAENQDILIKSWQQMLEGIPYEIFNQALLTVLKHAEFAPRIGTIINECERIMSVGEKTPEELWDELQEAVRKSYDARLDAEYAYVGTEERIKAEKKVKKIFDGMSAPIRKYCVSVKGFKAVCDSDPEYEKPRFLKRIGSIKEIIKTEEQLPKEVKLIAETIGSKMRLS